jgi:hypothetical protein
MMRLPAKNLTALAVGLLLAAPANAQGQSVAVDRALVERSLDAMTANCTSANAFDRAALTAKGWTFDTSYSLRAQGQRSITFKHAEFPGHISHRSSFVEFVSCSASVDIADPTDFMQLTDRLAKANQATTTSAPLLSPAVERFIKLNELSNLRDFAESSTHLFLFELRQFNGRNLMIVYTFRKAGKAPK